MVCPPGQCPAPNEWLTVAAHLAVWIAVNDFQRVRKFDLAAFYRLANGDLVCRFFGVFRLDGIDNPDSTGFDHFLAEFRHVQSSLSMEYPAPNGGLTRSSCTLCPGSEFPCQRL